MKQIRQTIGKHCPTFLGILLGFGDRVRRIGRVLRIHRRASLRAFSIFAFLALLTWLWFSLRPDTWHCYTDDVSFRVRARDAVPTPVIWEDATALQDAVWAAGDAVEPALSPDGATMVFTRGLRSGNANLFFSQWDGANWGAPRPARALNSPFHERGAAFSRDGAFLFFATDRPGGPGAFDIWVSRWDGAEFAWPVPLSLLVNSPYNELGPSPTSGKLYFCSDRPAETVASSHIQGSITNATQAAGDYDMFSADQIPAGVTNSSVERAMSMLYYLREAALSDVETMQKLGGTQQSEAALASALRWLKNAQDPDGQWNLARHGGSGGHDVAATSLALLTFFGRGQRHDQEGPYQDTVARGLAWLIDQQRVLGGMRGGGNFYDHGFATLALGEAYGLSKDEALHDVAQSAVNYIVDWQHEDGGWRYNPTEEASDLSVTGWQIMALKNAQLTGLFVPQRTFTGIRRWLKSVQHGSSGGIYSYQPQDNNKSLAMLSTGLFCSQLMGLSPNSDCAVETALKIGESGVRSDDFYYAYYGTLAANQNQGRLWRMWQEELSKQFIASQNKDGSWDPRGKFAEKMGKVVGTSLAALSLQAHYRYTPMYGLGYEADTGTVVRASRNLMDLPDVPEYRRARRLPGVNSSADDMHPVATLHGDFLYFSSQRPGGSGGFDVYRTRISRNADGAPRNVGPGINSAANEVDPAVSMAGFHLLVSSNRDSEDKDVYRLYHSVSRRVQAEINQRFRPSLGWMLKTYPLQAGLFLLAAAFVAYWAFTVRQFLRRKLPARAPMWLRVRRVLRTFGPLLLAVFILAGSWNSIGTGLRRTLWLDYTDGAGLRRNAQDEDARLVLWNTHVAPGRLPSFADPVQPEFVPDETAFSFALSTQGATNQATYMSRWDGRAWSRPEPGLLPATPTNMPGLSVRGGGAHFAHVADDSTFGGADIVRIPIVNGTNGPMQNLGLQVNSPADELAPAARMRGFDLLFCSSRGSADPPVYTLQTATAREVISRMDYTRWYNFTSMLGRLKWWIAALVVAVIALFYLLRNWKDITSLRHKCLMASLAIHLLILLIMAFCIISIEMIEAVDARAGDAALNVDNLAAEKLALDIESELSELPALDDALTAEKQQTSIELPEFTPQPVEDAAPIATDIEEQSFVTKVEASRAEDEAVEIADAKLDKLLPELEMPASLVPETVEELTTQDSPPPTAPREPEVRQEPVEVARIDVQAPAPVPRMDDAMPQVDPAHEAAQPRTLDAALARAVRDEEVSPATVELPATLPQMEMAPASESLEAAQIAVEVAEQAQPAPTIEQESLQTAARPPQTPASQPQSTMLEVSAVPALTITNRADVAKMVQVARANSEESHDRSIAALKSTALDLPAYAPQMEMAAASESLEAVQIAVEVAEQAQQAPAIEQESLQTAALSPQAPAPQPQSTMLEVDVVAVTTPVDADLGATVVQGMAAVVEQGADRTVAARTLPRIELARMDAAAAVPLSVQLELSPDSQVTETTPANTRGQVDATLDAASMQDGLTVARLPAQAPSPRASASLPVEARVSTLAPAEGAQMASALPHTVAHVAATIGTTSPQIARTAVAPGLPKMVMPVVQSAMETGTGMAPVVPDAEGRQDVMLITAAMQGGLPPGKQRSVGMRVLPSIQHADGADLGVVRRPAAAANPQGAVALSAAESSLAGVRSLDSSLRASVALQVAANGLEGELAIPAPGALEVASSVGGGVLPEVLRNPGKLSDQIVESLGGSAETQGAIVSALDWFTQNQERNGRWDIARHGGEAGHDVGATSLTLLCYYGWGARHNEEGPHRDAVQRAVTWLLSQMRKDGDMRGWLNRRYEDDILLGNMYDHAIATIALCEAFTLTKDPALRDPVQRAVDFLVRAQDKNLGGWRYEPGKGSDTSVLGWVYMALKSAELAGVDVPQEVFRGADRWLDSMSGGAAGGIYGYQKPEAKRPAMIATGMFCRRLAGAHSSGADTLESVRYIAMHPLQADNIDYYYLYYGTLALFQYGGEPWDQWNDEMKAILPIRQRKTGRNKGTWEPAQWYGDQMGRVGSTAISTLSLEVYYRLLPIYGLDAAEAMPVKPVTGDE